MGNGAAINVSTRAHPRLYLQPLFRRLAPPRDGPSFSWTLSLGRPADNRPPTAIRPLRNL